MIYSPVSYTHLDVYKRQTVQMEQALCKEVVRKQLDMLRFRTCFPAFSFDSEISVDVQGSRMTFEWKKAGYTAVLKADLWDICLLYTSRCV